MPEKYLAFDLGAESGRGLVATVENDILTFEEIGRFPTSRGELDIDDNGVRRWDIKRISSRMQDMLSQVEDENGAPIDGVGVDTWGVDFGLSDADNVLIEEPVAYRDASHTVARKNLLSRITEEQLWTESGVQSLSFNTLFQLQAILERDPQILARATRLNFMPDLLTSALGESTDHATERTIASTSQLVDVTSGTWNIKLLESLHIPSHFLQPIADAGTSVGYSTKGTPLFRVPGHDTAAAVAAVPVRDAKPWAFISSGTWSLMGTEINKPILSECARNKRLSNEGGINNTTRLLKNIMGLWLVQECKRSFSKSGADHSYAELAELAHNAPDRGPLIDAIDDRFLAPPDMPTEIRNACRESGQEPPNSVATLIRCCLDSLALAYKTTLQDLELATGLAFKRIHIVGGGVKNELLNQLTANACGVPVIAGPSEATALGNVYGQMLGSGHVASWAEARDLGAKSFKTQTFEPQNELDSWWSEARLPKPLTHAS